MTIDTPNTTGANAGRALSIFQSERRQNGRDSFGEHALTGAGRANEQFVVTHFTKRTEHPQFATDRPASHPCC
jgi:hypothetical protein